MDPEYVSINDLAPLAIDRIEPLSIEGLRIQSGMSDENAPSRISPQSLKYTSPLQEKTTNSSQNVDELLNFSLALDEWIKLDGGISTGDQISRQTIRILEAHHAKCIYYDSGRRIVDENWTEECGKNHGLLADNITLAFRVQLRDPFRNFEPVGMPTLALVQLERISVLETPDFCCMEDIVAEEEINGNGTKNKNGGDFFCQFKVIDLHLAGIQTEPSNLQLQGTLRQQQLGARWLLASGMGKANKYPSSNSKAIVRASQSMLLKGQHEDIMWSISSLSWFTGRAKSELATLHARNPDIIFPNDSMRLHRKSYFRV